MNRLVIHLKKAHGSESYETIYSVSSEIVIRGPGPLLHGAPPKYPTYPSFCSRHLSFLYHHMHLSSPPCPYFTPTEPMFLSSPLIRSHTSSPPSCVHSSLIHVWNHASMAAHHSHSRLVPTAQAIPLHHLSTPPCLPHSFLPTPFKLTPSATHLTPLQTWPPHTHFSYS